MHGARSGAPKGNSNNLQHGFYSARAAAFRRRTAAIIRASRDLLGEL